MLPLEPKHGDIVETSSGIIYQYDATINSWIKIPSSNKMLPVATYTKPGVMESSDLKKLNRLVIPPPASTIKGTDCLGPFLSGTIRLLSGDRFIEVQGGLDLKNIDEFGDRISKNYPFHIHQHTYGYNFNLNITELVSDLINRNKLNVVGQKGKTGPDGERGEPGVDRIISGPQGEEGEQGDAPECNLSLQYETITTEIQPGLNRALSNVRIVPDPEDPTNHRKFALQFDRQVVGKPDTSTNKFKVRQQNSYWLLAVESITGTPQEVYHLDIEPVIESIRNKFLEEIQLLKKGYEDIVEFWIQTMSDLFDEQKAALCCALEFCISKTKSTQLRQHMESVAASALPTKIRLYGRDSQQAVEISSTRMLGDLPDNSDLCDNGEEFPTRPPPRVVADQVGKCSEIIKPVTHAGGKGYHVISVELGSGTGTVVLNYQAYTIPDKFVVYYDGNTVINTGYRGNATSWQSRLSDELLSRGWPDETIQGPGRGSASFEKTTTNSIAIVEVWGPLGGTAWEFELTCPPGSITPSIASVEENIVPQTIEHARFESGSTFNVDSVVHIGSPLNGLSVDLPAGDYVATIIDTSSFINNDYRGNVRIVSGNKNIDFMNKGGFKNLLDSRAAYSGLTLSFKHDGGDIVIYYPMLPIISASGVTKIMLTRSEDIVAPKKTEVIDGCFISTDIIRDYERAWLSGKCCSVIVKLGGQDFIIVKRSIEDDSCGGGGSIESPCIGELIEHFGRPSFAWPTLDGKSFSQIPDVDEVLFRYDQDYNDLVNQKILDNDYKNPLGNPNGLRHLSHQLSSILFPFS